MRILLVEDDPLIGSGAEAGLRQGAFAVDWVQNSEAAQLALTTTEYALIILDLGLPGMSGLELLKLLRRKGDATAVLILSAKDSPVDRVKGLNEGADDYLGKPFDLHELLARSRALMRRSQGRSSEEIVYGDLRLNVAAKTVYKDGKRVPITSRELAVLTRLITHLDIPQSRSRLEESLYGWRDEIESNAIEVHVYNLRKKLGADLIRTVRNIGYVIEKLS